MNGDISGDLCSLAQGALARPLRGAPGQRPGAFRARRSHSARLRAARLRLARNRGRGAGSGGSPLCSSVCICG